MPLFFAAYFLVPGRVLKNVWLLIASLVFYAWGEPVYILLMLASIFANWIFGIAVESRDESGELRRTTRHKVCLIAAICFNILVIGFFKYEGFLAANINGLLGSNLIPDLELPLPIGISFYTLQALSYVIDVYRGDVRSQRNILYLGMYIACFPQLIAGPIVRYSTIQEQVLNRKETLDRFADGFRLFIVGFAKKALLANTVAILAQNMIDIGGPAIGVAGAWAGLIAYTFQIFFDFSGYSDMAIGLGRMMGFEYLRNFNYPYISRSITEFWRRWHISLSTFFRDYVYIPLGGSRCSKARNILNIAVVWTITGLWHGAAWNYVGWGMYYGLLLILEKFVWGKALSKAPSFVGHIYTIAIFVFGWSFFWITDPSQLVDFWKAMFGAFGTTGTSTFWEVGGWEYWPVFIICVLASTPLCPFLKERLIAWIENRKPKHVLVDGIANPRSIETTTLCTFDAEPATRGRSVVYQGVAIAYNVALLALFVFSCMSVVSGSFNPFIYFQF